MNDHSNALPVGYRLGEYEIQTVLGSGGFGVTYKAHDHNLDKLVAIKEYLPVDFAVRDGLATVKPKSNASKDDYAWGLTRFLDEARTLARFDHPHINKVHRYFQDNGTAYLVLEYIEGDMLSDLLKRKGRFNTVGLRRMLDELLDGLDAVHSAGYIHRDIKPANIIFRRDGSAVLLDFGAARQAIGKRSQTITSILTPGYAPVEQYLNTIDAMGAWSDLYSLGVVAYRCLLGGDESVLIDAPSRAHLVQRGEVEKDMPAAVKVGEGNYPMSLLQAIDWAMKVDERERPQSVAEMRAVLAGGDEVAQSVKPKSSVRVKKKGVKRIASLLKMLQSRRRMLGWTLGGIGAVVLLVAVFGVPQYQQWQAEKAEEAWAAHVEWERKNAEAKAAARAEQQRKIAEEKRVAEAERRRKDAELNRILGSELRSFRGLKKRDPSVRQVDDGRTDLHTAAWNGWAKIAQWLIDNGADVNAKDQLAEFGIAPWGYAPLHWAVYKNAVAIAEMLITSGADVNAQSNEGKTPLHMAARDNKIELVKLLLANGADVNATDIVGTTPLHNSVYGNRFATAQLLLANGADVNSNGLIGATPLHIAARDNKIDFAKLLLANDADVNSKDDLVWTPLHLAVRENEIDAAKLLIANGADVNAQTRDGNTPLDVAIKEKRDDIVVLLEQHSGQCNRQCN